MPKTIRLRDDACEEIEERTIKMIVETKVRVKDSDLLHALVWKFLDQLTTKDVMEYREKVLGKDD